jgi:aminopeptidase N
VLTLTTPTETLVFSGIEEPPVLSINRGFSAPVRISTNISANDLRFLAAHDSDPFNRWQALQTLATKLLVDNTAALRAGAQARADEGLLDAYAAILADRTLEPAFVALALTPPSEADIAREIGRDVDPDAIFRARAGLRALIGLHLNAALTEIYKRMSSRGRYKPNAKSAGRRSLRNVALDLLAATGSARAVSRAARQYAAADNMTDRMAALATLALHDVPERAAALEDFYLRFKDDPLVIDKWLTLQAAIPESSTLDQVRALTKHPAFSFSNPNRIRSLIGAFAQGNPTQFHRADGQGYDFLAETVLTLDPKNPQVAARLLSAFKTWRALEPSRRARAEAALRRVDAAPALSRDVQDIVQRTLADA